VHLGALGRGELGGEQADRAGAGDQHARARGELGGQDRPQGIAAGFYQRAQRVVEEG
jgi:hypothetical protein